MRIQEDVKLDFNDVLIKPKRSTLESRKDAVLVRTFAFKHSKKKWAGVPIIAANMDHTGTYEMNKVLYDYAMLTAICKFTTYAPVYNAIKTIGLDQNLDELDYDLEWVCLDVANGYTERFMDFVEQMRQHEATKNSIIIAGNVCTPEATEQIILAGADIVKIGIGPGCFAPSQKVKTKTGDKNIEDIEIGEDVLTHKNQYKKVTNTFQFNDKKTIMTINGIKCTPNHEFYVLHKKHRDYVNDDNIHEYAEWICAKNLTKEYLLLKI